MVKRSAELVNHGHRESRFRRPHAMSLRKYVTDYANEQKLSLRLLTELQCKITNELKTTNVVVAIRRDPTPEHN